MNKLALAALATTTLLGGCAIQQTVRPVEQPLAGREICVIDSPGVRSGFLHALKRSLADKGYLVRQLPATAAVSDCPVTATYSGTWSWDLALYMSYAEIRIFGGGRQIGEAKYDSTGGGATLTKFIEADKKIAELVDQLFPGGAGATRAESPSAAASAASAATATN